MHARIVGQALPVLQLELRPGETLVAETGQLSWMSGNMTLRTAMAAGGATGLLGAVSRALGGGGLFLTEFRAEGGPGEVAFASRIPGGIRAVELAPDRPALLIHRHGFLCATDGVVLGAAIQRSLGAGIFGGDGFRLQRLSGRCTAWVELGGEIVERGLDPGQTMLVHPGHVGMFEETVGFDVTLMRGVANAIFGGDGLFLARLTGPGRVWLQTLTLPNLAHSLAPYLGEGVGRGVETGASAGLAASLVRNLLGRS